MRRLAAWLLAVAVLGALVFFAFEKIDFRQVRAALAHVRVGWVVVSGLFMGGTFLARGESWYVAIREALPSPRVGRFTVTRVMLIGMFGSSVAPGRLGEAARAWLIARHAGGARGTLATVLGTLLTQILLNVLALLILAAVALAGGAIPGAHAVAIIPVVALPVVALIALPFMPRILRAVAHDRNHWGRMLNWAARQVGDLDRGVAVFRRPGSAIHSGGFQLGGWVLQTGACYAVILAFGLQNRANIATAAAILFAVNVTAVLPLTPANVGIFQATCIAVLAPVGVRSGTGLAYGLVLQAVEVFAATALGVPSLLREGLSPRDLGRGGRGRPLEPDKTSEDSVPDRDTTTQAV